MPRIVTSQVVVSLPLAEIVYSTFHQPACDSPAGRSVSPPCPYVFESGTVIVIHELLKWFVPPVAVWTELTSVPLDRCPPCS